MPSIFNRHNYIYSKINFKLFKWKITIKSLKKEIIEQEKELVDVISILNVTKNK